MSEYRPAEKSDDESGVDLTEDRLTHGDRGNGGFRGLLRELVKMRHVAAWRGLWKELVTVKLRGEW